MNLRKIDSMHHYYGYGAGFCGDCPHFLEKLYSRKYFKCSVYGDSDSEATDWRRGYTACGLIDKPFPVGETRIVARIIRQKTDEQPIPGQLTMDDMLRRCD